MPEPVGYTCGDIDTAITAMSDARDAFDELLAELEKLEDLPKAVVDATRELQEKVEEFDCAESSLEDVRSANEQLRDWGNEEEADKEDLETELSNLKFEYNEARERIIELEEQVEMHESEKSSY